MTHAHAKPSDPSPALWPALAAMTALQAIVALALFAPGVLAPRLGIGEGAIALFTTGCFAVGMAGALWGGALVARFGSFGVACLCMLAVIAAMALGASGGLAALGLAGLALGVAFGPETPASSALLAQLARPEQRPLIFSVRQTGNQIGAIIGSLTLPALALVEPRLGYAAVIGVAALALVVFLGLRRRYDPLTRAAGQSLDPRAALDLLRRDPGVFRLAALSMPFSAMQLALNAFLVTYLVAGLGVGHIAAGVLLAFAQGGGLLGRVSWGAVAGWVGAAQPVLAGLGLAMGAAALGVALLPVQPPFLLAAGLAFVFGLSASGWNGVFLAEVARAAPEGRIGDATGAVLTASYAGLVSGPLLISGLAAMGGMRLAYAFIGLCCALAALWMVMRR